MYVCVNLLQVYQGAACRSSCGSCDSPGAVCTAGRQDTGLERCEWSNHQLVSHNVTSHYVSYMTHYQAMSICHMNSHHHMTSYWTSHDLTVCHMTSYWTSHDLTVCHMTSYWTSHDLTVCHMTSYWTSHDLTVCHMTSYWTSHDLTVCHMNSY